MILQFKRFKLYQCCLLGLLALPAMIFAIPLPTHALQTQPKTFKDYGTQGHTFPIIERSLLEVIVEKLKLAEQSGHLQKLQTQFKEKVKAKVARPVAVKGITHTETERTFTFDPSVTQQGDVKDHRGTVVVKDGTTVNPLDHLDWGQPLIFIDGDAKDQVAWALQQTGDIILVKGAPLQLQEDHNHWFYFDQAGILSSKFGITQVPAIISQQGKVLVIQEKRI